MQNGAIAPAANESTHVNSKGNEKKISISSLFPFFAIFFSPFFLFRLSHLLSFSGPLFYFLGLAPICPCWFATEVAGRPCVNGKISWSACEHLPANKSFMHHNEVLNAWLQFILDYTYKISIKEYNRYKL